MTAAPKIESDPHGEQTLTLTSLIGFPEGVLRFREILVLRCWKWNGSHSLQRSPWWPR